MNTKDVEEYMTENGWRLHQTADGKYWVHQKSAITSVNEKTAAFLYQQTLLSRRDELDRLPISGVITAGGYRHDGASEYVIKRRLAELNQLLQGSHNREEEK